MSATDYMRSATKRADLKAFFEKYVTMRAKFLECILCPSTLTTSSQVVSHSFSFSRASSKSVFIPDQQAAYLNSLSVVSRCTIFLSSPSILNTSKKTKSATITCIIAVFTASALFENKIKVTSKNCLLAQYRRYAQILILEILLCIPAVKILACLDLEPKFYRSTLNN